MHEHKFGICVLISQVVTMWGSLEGGPLAGSLGGSQTGHAAVYWCLLCFLMTNTTRRVTRMGRMRKWGMTDRMSMMHNVAAMRPRTQAAGEDRASAMLSRGMIDLENEIRSAFLALI